MNKSVEYTALCNEYSELSKAYNAMPDTLRTSANALKLTNRMKVISKRLVEIDAGVGKWHRPVGNYSHSLNQK